MKYARVLAAVLLACFGLFRSVRAFAAEIPLADTRSEFAAKLRELPNGSSAEEAIRRLGPPDAKHPRDIDTTGEYADVTSVWYYGIDRADGFPSLGRVYFGDPRKGVLIRAGFAPPVMIEGLSESQLRKVLGTLSGPNPCHAYDFDPRRLIAAVNALHALGKARALSVVDEYRRILPENHGTSVEEISLVLRVLFEPPQDGHMPEFLFSGTTPAPPDDLHKVPRFPVHVVADIPLLIVLGYSYEGRPPRIDDELEWYRKRGSLRKEPLVPADEPMQVLFRLESTEAWKYTPRGNRDRAMVIAQLLQLQSSARPLPPTGDKGKRALSLAPIERWKEYEEGLRALPITWDRGTQKYVAVRSDARQIEAFANPTTAGLSMHAFESQFAAAWPPEEWADITVVLAVSGGADSVALLRAAERLKRERGGAGGLVVGHFNHGLRGAEAERDERFVAETCERLGVACHVGRAEPGQIAGQSSDGLEQAARVARYRFLRGLADELGARFVATAHTADDQAETILHRILRGTGVRGLAGIPRVRRLGHASLIRPMLFARRSDVLDYLAALDQPFCHDTSNADRTLTRNRIRHELLPALASGFNPGVVDALLRLGTQARELQAVVDNFAAELYDRCVVSLPQGSVRIERGPLIVQPPLLVREVLIAVWRRHEWPLQAMGYAEWEELAAMATGEEIRRRQFPGNVTADATAEGLVLTPERAAGRENRREQRKQRGRKRYGGGKKGKTD